jgi:phosphoadenosine phosphosulfate reductase
LLYKLSVEQHNFMNLQKRTDPKQPDFSSKDLVQLNERFEDKHPDDVLKWSYDTFGLGVVLGTGFGPSGIFLIHRIYNLGLRIPVFYLDTNLLFDETYRLRDTLEDKYQLSILRLTPELSLEEQADQFGEKLWEKNPDKCCEIRKVAPLRKYLADKKGWITGLRRSQSPSRSQTPILIHDPANQVLKINPLAAWDDDQIWDYIRLHNLPYNPLHDDGYPSVGCIPCTSPVLDGEDVRNGRWRGTGKLECGIHLPGTENNDSIKNNSTNQTP